MSNKTETGLPCKKPKESAKSMGNSKSWRHPNSGLQWLDFVFFYVRRLFEIISLLHIGTQILQQHAEGLHKFKPDEVLAPKQEVDMGSHP